MNKNLFSISIIFILVFSRLIPHPPNFTPIITVSIMSAFLFKNFYTSLTVLLISMLLSDFFIGTHSNMIFVYFSLFLVCYISYTRFIKFNYKNIFVYSIMGSLLFFVISNFGVWFLGNLYTPDLNGLINCYILAIPFFKNIIISTVFFSYIAYFATNIYEKKSHLYFN